MIISWNTTRKCHLKCPHCYRDAGEKDPRELDTYEGKRLLDEIAKAGFKIIILSGGEPLYRQDIFELTGYAFQKGLHPVFGTTGTTLDLYTVQRLKSAGAQCLGISLDSCDPVVHDAFRGVNGAWDKAIQGMQLCAREELPFQINTTAVAQNHGEIENITDLAQEIGARAHHVFFLVPTGRGREITDEMLTPVQSEKLLKRILQKQQSSKIEIKPTCAPQFMRLAKQMDLTMRFTRGCLAGLSYCCILPDGEVHPCPYLPLSAGNIREIPFDKIWKEASLFHEMRHGELNGKCGVCRYSKECGGCRARAYYESSDVMGEDNWCLYGKEVNK